MQKITRCFAATINYRAQIYTDILLFNILILYIFNEARRIFYNFLVYYITDAETNKLRPCFLYSCLEGLAMMSGASVAALKGCLLLGIPIDLFVCSWNIRKWRNCWVFSLLDNFGGTNSLNYYQTLV